MLCVYNVGEYLIEHLCTLEKVNTVYPPFFLSVSSVIQTGYGREIFKGSLLLNPVLCIEKVFEALENVGRKVSLIYNSIVESVVNQR